MSLDWAVVAAAAWVPMNKTMTAVPWWEEENAVGAVGKLQKHKELAAAAVVVAPIGLPTDDVRRTCR